MKIFKTIVLSVAAVVIIIMIVVYLSIDRIAVFSLSKAYNLDITYAALKRSSLTGFSFSSLKCIDKKRRVGFSSKSAQIDADFKNMAVDFVLRDVHFLKESSDNISSYDSLAGLVAAPFKSDLQYIQMSGSVRPLMNGVELVNFAASSDLMKLTLKGDAQASGTIRSDIVIFFSPELTNSIPKELSTTLLCDEPDGWKSLAVTLSGDYKKPSIQVTGKLFRLSIKEISSKK